MCRVAHDDDVRLAAALRHGRNARQRSKRGIVSAAQGPRRLGEQGGEGDSADPRQGLEDGDIAWLAALSFRCPFAQLRAELIKLALSLMTFTIDDAQPSKQGAQMEDSCLGDACGHLDGGLPQDATGGLCVKPADAMLFEQPCNGRLTQAVPARSPEFLAEWPFMTRL